MTMGITQALKLQEGPIDALAKLPQQQLMAMAQQGRIPADMLPIILNEKAQMAEQAANMQAMQKPMPPSVTERNISINAQAEAPQMQPQMMAMAQPQMPPMDAGVASLPVPEEMYSNEYAGGGIVAFQEGGDLNSALASMYNAATKEMDEDSARREVNPYVYSSRVNPDRIEELVGARGAMRERIAPQSPKVAAIQSYLADQARKNTDVRTDAWTRALEAGLGIMGGESPYALTNIGKGSQAAVKGFAEDVKERRKKNLANMQLELQLDEAARKEKLGDITAAEATALKELEAERDLEKSRITAQKDKVMDTYAKNFLEAYRNDPRFKGKTDAQILQLGREDYLNRAGAALIRGEAAGRGVDVREREADTRIEAAVTASDDKINKEYNVQILTAETPAEKKRLEAERDAKKARRAAEIRGGGVGAAPTSGNAPTSGPAKLPAGAKQIGTSGGKPVFQLPDGSRVVAQ